MSRTFIVIATGNSMIIANEGADDQYQGENLGSFTLEAGDPISINGEHIFVVKAKELASKYYEDSQDKEDAFRFDVPVENIVFLDKSNRVDPADVITTVVPEGSAPAGTSTQNSANKLTNEDGEHTGEVVSSEALQSEHPADSSQIIADGPTTTVLPSPAAVTDKPVEEIAPVTTDSGPTPASEEAERIASEDAEHRDEDEEHPGPAATHEGDVGAVPVGGKPGTTGDATVDADTDKS